MTEKEKENSYAVSIELHRGESLKGVFEFDNKFMAKQFAETAMDIKSIKLVTIAFGEEND